MDHITQYIQLFAGAIIVFVMYLEHMMPKDKITLDTDWFYRKPFKYAVLYTSKGVDSIRLNIGSLLEKGVAKDKREYVKIYCCGDCIYYNWKKHKCNRGASEEGKPTDRFYRDCPLGLNEEEVKGEGR